MSKFGELIDSEMPILLDFYTDWNESSTSMHPVLKDVAAAIGIKEKSLKSMSIKIMSWRKLSGLKDCLL